MTVEKTKKLSEVIFDEITEAEKKGVRMTVTKSIISDFQKDNSAWMEKQDAESNKDPKFVPYMEEYIRFLDDPNKEARIKSIINQIMSALILLKDAPWNEKKGILNQIKADLAEDESKIVPPMLFIIKKEYRFIFIQLIDRIGEFLEKEGT